MELTTELQQRMADGDEDSMLAGVKAVLEKKRIAGDTKNNSGQHTRRAANSRKAKTDQRKNQMNK